MGRSGSNQAIKPGVTEWETGYHFLKKILKAKFFLSPAKPPCSLKSRISTPWFHRDSKKIFWTPGQEMSGLTHPGVSLAQEDMKMSLLNRPVHPLMWTNSSSSSLWTHPVSSLESLVCTQWTSIQSHLFSHRDLHLLSRAGTSLIILCRDAPLFSHASFISDPKEGSVPSPSLLDLSLFLLAKWSQLFWCSDHQTTLLSLFHLCYQVT